MFVVTVTFHLHPGAMEAFLPLMQVQADTSMRAEPGCHRFDICGSAGQDAVFLYELYTDAAAFQDHLQSPHFLEFDAAIAPLVAAKTVATHDWMIKGRAAQPG